MDDDVTLEYIEREARAFLEACQGEVRCEPVVFEDALRRAIELTVRMRAAAGKDTPDE
jgi:hypothetical protein